MIFEVKEKTFKLIYIAGASNYEKFLIGKVIWLDWEIYI